ncbi:MAG TPA: T9SS type A sorting domain-containing protein [Puia sp.]|jgi:hypothetical protein|nr:T9SS type A sorting domain-containing protein [Puia sp.]
MKRKNFLKIYFDIGFFTSIFLFSFNDLYSQCSPSAPAAATCSGTLLTNSANINSGTYYWPTGSTGTISSASLNAGILRVCGTLTLTGFNFNGGTVIVESGGSLTFSSSVSMSGSIANRGTVKVNGNFAIQTTGQYLWNEASAVSFTVTGTLTINGGSVINKSTLSANTMTVNGPGGICMQENAIIAVSSLTNNPTNSVSYSGAAFNAGCVSISSSATLNNPLTASSSILVCKASGVTNSGWGSATVFPNCTNCNIPLPLNIENFSAVNEGNKIALNWTTGGNITGEVFNVQRSTDGINFETIAVVDAQNVNNYSAYDNNISASQQFYRIEQISQNGSLGYSPIVIVKTGFGAQLMIFPNPVKQKNALSIIYNSLTAGNIQLSLIDLSGKILSLKNSLLINGRNELSIGMKNILAGTYILKIHSDTNGDAYNKIIVLP